MKQHTGRRVVVTGLGVVAPNGIGQQAFWEASASGLLAIEPIQRFSTGDIAIKVAGQIPGFVATHYIDRKLANRTDRSTQFALIAVEEALRDAQLTLEKEHLQRTGALIASTIGGVEYVVKELQAMYVRGPRAMSAYTAIAWLQVANVGQISIRHGIQGYSKTPIHDANGSIDALGLAYRAIRRGSAEVIIAGGCEAPLEPNILLVLTQSGQCAMGDDPTAYRPFDRRAGGLLLAEGAGICILEEYEHARQRGARIYGEIAGYSQTNDAYSLTVPSAGGKHYARAIHLAMQEGQISPRDVAYFSADGHALDTSDSGEAEALHLAFGSDCEKLPVSVPRTMTGHSSSASGAIDTITALLALNTRTIPPTINCEQLDPRYGLNLVRDTAHPLTGSAVLLGSRATGGANSVLAIKKVEE